VLFRSVEWQTAGIPTRDVLRAATCGNAATFGLSERCGSIAAGLVADLVLLRSDPELSPANLTDVAGVVVRGQYLDRAELERRKAALHARQQEALNAATRPLDIPPPTLPEGTKLLEGYAETATDGVRTAGERWAVVVEADGATTFVGRRFVPGTGGHQDVDLELTQRIVDGALDSFHIDLATSSHRLAVRGQWVAGQMRVERTLDGAHAGSDASAERPACIDVESLTSYVLLAHFERRPKFSVLRFHAGLALESVRWERAEDPKGWFVYRTPSGGRAAEISARGALSRLVTQQGSGQVETRTLATSGPGFPLPQAK
jgi:hypothetical protein